ncbi:MAG: DUF6702 family protein [Planctomycetaceae bacterium]
MNILSRTSICCGKAALAALWILAAGTSSTAASVLHPFHSSIAEAEWNSETSRFEVALKLNGAEFEQELSQLHNRRINIETSEGAEEIVRSYVQQRFCMATASHPHCRMHWAGMEVAIRDVWLYFEVEPAVSQVVDTSVTKPDPQDDLPATSETTSPVSLSEIKITNSLLTTSRPEQVNLVTVLVDRKRHSTHFTSTQKTVTIRWETFGEPESDLPANTTPILIPDAERRGQ